MKNINFKEIDVIYHISDKDLDGYGSQTIVKEYTKNLGLKLKMFNPSREEILSNINNVFSEIIENKKLKYLILITDLSLEEEHVKKMNNFKRGNKNIDVEYQLLDHHISGQKIAEKNDWFYLDLKNCSARITYLFMEKHFGKNITLDNISNLIQVKDLWIKSDKNFNKATFFSDSIMNIHYPEIFKEKEKNEKYFLIKKLGKLLSSEISLNESEHLLIEYKHEYYNKFLPENVKSKDLSVEIKKQYYFNELFKKIENNFEIINIENFKMKILYNIEPHIFQVLSSLYLEENDIDILMNLNINGKLSLRCKQDININLSDISLKYFGGGGHEKAAGAKIELKEDFYSQKKIENYIKNIIKNKNNQELNLNL